MLGSCTTLSLCKKYIKPVLICYLKIVLKSCGNSLGSYVLIPNWMTIFFIEA
jgi:hypothetical protein